MVLYSIIMFLAAIPMIKVSIAIYQGKTSLIHDYHQTKVTDPVGYGKAFGKALSVMAAALLLSGIVGLLGDSEAYAKLAVAVLMIGIVIGVICIVAVQRKYNKGIF